MAIQEITIGKKALNKGVERDAKICGGPTGQGFWHAPHPKRSAKRERDVRQTSAE